MVDLQAVGYSMFILSTRRKGLVVDVSSKSLKVANNSKLPSSPLREYSLFSCSLMLPERL